MKRVNMEQYLANPDWYELEQDRSRVLLHVLMEININGSDMTRNSKNILDLRNLYLNY